MLKCCTQYASKFGKLGSGHRTEKGQFSFQSQRRTVPKNVPTTIQLHSFHILTRSCSKSSKLGFNSMWTENFQIPAGFRKGGRTRDQIANIHWIIEKAREFQKNIYFIDYAKTFDCVDHNKLWKILKEMGIPDHLTCLLRNLYVGQEATVRTEHETTDWLKIAKRVHQGCIMSPCLFKLYADTLGEMPSWISHKLESRLPGEISITSDMQMTPC